MSWCRVQCPDDTESISGTCVNAVAITRAQHVRRPIPRAAAHHAFGAVALEPRRAVRWRILGVALVVTILRPLPAVAMNLIEPELVRHISIDRLRTFAVFAPRPVGVGGRCRIVGLLRGDGFAKPERRRGAGAGEIFALGFTRQPVGAADLLRQPREIGFRSLKIDALPASGRVQSPCRRP